MFNKNRFFRLCFLLFLISLQGLAQVSNDTSSTFTVAYFLKNADKIYLDELQETLVLYNGREYVSSDNRIDGHPFYISDKFEEGTVEYFDQLFENIPLMYDIYTDDVVTEHFNQGYKIQLNSLKVGSFSYLGNKFVRISNDSSVNTIPKAGFYQLLYDGEVKVFAKRKKIIYEQIKEAVFREYQSQNSFFIKKNDIFYSVKSKKSALAPFKEFKKELNKALRARNLKFRKAKDQSLIVIATEYDKLSNQ